MSYSKEDIIRMVEEEDVEFIRLRFTDTFGQLKNVTITVSQIERAMNDRIMLDGSLIGSFVRIDKSDQCLCPDPDSSVIFSWRPSHDRVARLICSIHDPDGKPFVDDFRHALKRVPKEAEGVGSDILNVGPEAGFFLFQTDDEDEPTTHTNDGASYFDLSPLDRGEGTRREICTAPEQMGFEVEASYREVAQGQHKIDFKYADALCITNNVVTFKLAVKTLAQKNGLHTTFMSKPIFGINGSGMHINMPLFQGGESASYGLNDPKGLSKEACPFITGLLAHVKGIAVATNSLMNPYKRLVPGYKASYYLAWSASNHPALTRVPTAREQSTRVELRSSDPAYNLYLELALCLAAGLDGIGKGLTPSPEVTGNVFGMNAAVRGAHDIDSLPDSLEEAIHVLEAGPLVLNTLGEHTAANYIEGKRKEQREYCTRVSSWEREGYIINY